MTLQVLICTCGLNRLEDLLQRGLPEVHRVKWLISVQCAESLPVNPRPDIEIVPAPGRGLSRNRNNAIRHASADVCLIADDDLVYYPEGLTQVIDIFENDPSLDFALFEYRCDECPKCYPEKSYIIGRHLAKNHYVTSFEIAFRRSSVADIPFNEHFGVGLPDYTAGEESLWITSLIKRSRKGIFAPVVICRHIGLTTAEARTVDPTVLHADGAVIAVSYPLTGLLRVFLKSWRLRSHGHTFRTLRHLLSGWLTATFRPSSLGLK